MMLFDTIWTVIAAVLGWAILPEVLNLLASWLG